jgi:hypothetical protein
MIGVHREESQTVLIGNQQVLSAQASLHGDASQESAPARSSVIVRVPMAAPFPSHAVGRCPCDKREGDSSGPALLPRLISSLDIRTERRPG